MTTRTSLTAALVALMALPTAAFAASTDAPSASDPLFIAAGQGGGERSSYSTVGGIVPLPGSQIGKGWVARVFAEEITYRYKLGTSHVDATAYGGAATVGFQSSSPNGWFGAYAGPAFRHTNLSPDDPNNQSGGSNAMARFQLEGESILNRDFKIDANVTLDAFNGEAYWTRLRLLSRMTGQMYIGPEGSYQGDNTYHAWSTGLAVVGIPITERATFGVDGGVRKVDAESPSGYAGFELGSSF